MVMRVCGSWEMQREAAGCNCSLCMGDVFPSLAGQMPGRQQERGVLAHCPSQSSALSSMDHQGLLLPSQAQGMAHCGSPLPVLWVKRCGKIKYETPCFLPAFNWNCFHVQMPDVGKPESKTGDSSTAVMKMYCSR